MARVVASAPGKVVVCGEYAVLDGAPAVSMAVDRRAIATVAPAQAGDFSITTRGFADATRRFVIRSDELEWHDDGPALPLIEAAWRSGILAAGVTVDIVLDTRAFSVGGRKLGIGSSAALTVALATASGQGDVAARAHDAHRDLQGSRGSGVDVATALQGGLIGYRMAGNRARSLTWPDELCFALLWSGVPADTTARLERLDAVATQPSRGELAAAAERSFEAWASGAPESILSELGRYTAALRRFDVDHGLGIFEAGHDRLLAAAPGGLVYKPCGAGGGDIGIAVASDESVLADFVAKAGQSGFERLGLGSDTAGVTIDEKDDE